MSEVRAAHTSLYSSKPRVQAGEEEQVNEGERLGLPENALECCPGFVFCFFFLSNLNIQVRIESMFKGTDVYILQGPLKLADMVPIPLNVVIRLFSFSSFIPVISHKNYY